MIQNNFWIFRCYFDIRYHTVRVKSKSDILIRYYPLDSFNLDMYSLKRLQKQV
jgi:hypothetical protein